MPGRSPIFGTIPDMSDSPEATAPAPDAVPAGNAPLASEVGADAVVSDGEISVAEIDQLTEPAPAEAAVEAQPWWNSAVFYQIYPRSFADSNGDGVGDLGGIREHLDYLRELGIDALWLSPVTRSPMADHGYDVSDPRDIDPLFGDLAAMDELLAAAHEYGIKVTMDLVPNHTSEEHLWFRAALSGAPGGPERARYIFRDGRGPHGDVPPNNWPSIFGGPAWTRVVEPDGSMGQWYLHLFAPEQPDLNFDNPEVVEDLERTLRFWLDRGIDGFRIDVAHGLAKPAGLPDLEVPATELMAGSITDTRFDNPGVHEIHKRIRSITDEYQAVTVGEIWVDDNDRFGMYLRPDELTLGFNFRLARAQFTAEDIEQAIANSLAAVDSVDAVATWTLSNHDISREVTRYGGGRIGTARARAMALVVLALPGVPFLYNGSELGLPDVVLPDEALQDPMFFCSGGTMLGRDGCRVPLPWDGIAPPYGFTTGATTWLPMPDDWAHLSVAAETDEPASMLTLYRDAIALRHSRPEFAAGSGFTFVPAAGGCVAFQRGDGLICVVNTTDEPVQLPPGTVLLSSAPMDEDRLPGDAAAWVRV